MKRPVVWLAAAFALGTAVSLNFSINYIIVITGCIIFTSYSYKKLSYLVLIPVFFLGILSVFLFNRSYIAPAEKYAGTTVTATFEITDKASSKSSGGYNEYTVKSLSPFKSTGSLYSPQSFDAGDIIETKCNIFSTLTDEKYRYIHINKENYFSAFSYNGKITGHADITLIQKIKALRNSIINSLLRRTDPKVSGFLSAILTGDKENLSSYRSETFRKTGLSHLMAVSGLHVSLLLGFLLYILNIIRTKRIITNIICTIFLLFLIPFMNFSPSATRAVIMNLVLLWSTTVKKDADSLSSLSFAALILLIFRPYSLKDLSFTLSFTATAGLILLSPVIDNLIEKIVKRKFPTLSTVLSVHIFLIPANIYYFGSFNLISIPANLLFVPVFPAILILLIVSTAIPQINFILNKITEIYLGAIETVSKLPFTKYEISVSEPFVFLLIITLGMTFVFKGKMRMMFIAVSILILLNIVLKGIEIF